MTTCYRGTVYPWNCDHFGHMNVKFYIEKFDQANCNLFATVGLTPRYFRKNNMGMAALEQRILYKRELLPGDNVSIESAVLKMTNKTLHTRHKMINIESGEIAAEMNLVAAHLDMALRKACPLPDFVKRFTETL